MNRIVVGAHYGLKDWLAQRVTATIMLVYILAMLVAIALSGEGYEGWRQLMSCGVIRFATFIFIVSLCYHAWVGVRDIWMDYVKPAGVRLLLHVVTLSVLVGYAGWATQIIWRL